MHGVAVLTDQQPSQATITSASHPPIGPYHRVPVQVHQADPHASQVARRLIALIATCWQATPAEHVGSSAVPGLAGKNIIDLLMAAAPADIPAIAAALLELGFQPQSPTAFPATRPMLWGTFRHRQTDYRIHVHVVPASSPEVTALRGFRDALWADPRLRVAGGEGGQPDGQARSNCNQTGFHRVWLLRRWGRVLARTPARRG